MTAYETVRRFFQREWQGRIPLLEGASEDSNPDDAHWARFHYQEGSGQPYGWGTTVPHLIWGVVTIQVFARDRKGLSRLRSYADQAAGILRSKTLLFGTNGRLVFRTPVVKMFSGDVPAQCNCMIEWWSEEDHEKPDVE